MINKSQILKIIKITLKKLDTKYYSDQAVDLIYNTGLVESNYQYLRQLGDGPARGFFQMEGATAVDICKNYLCYRPKLMGKIENICFLNNFVIPASDQKQLEFLLETNIGFSILMTRLHYRRVPKPLPYTLEDQAIYWKAYYNSHLGKGTVEKFIEICK